jgi:acyl-CoA thioester hydrolase
MNDRQKVSATVRMKVSFHDLDPFNVVWHGNYLKYFEVAREALFEKCGIDLPAYHRKTGIIFPVIRSTVKHIRPLTYQQEFLCTASVHEARRKIALDFEISLPADSAVCTRGSTEQVAVHAPTMRLELRIPKDIGQALGG